MKNQPWIPRAEARGSLLQLPSSVQADKVEAAFDKCVLKITLSKVEEVKKKQIEIKVK